MNQTEFEQIFIAYFGAICLYGQRLLGDLQAAEDLAEDLFTKIWENGSVEAVTNIRAYLYTAMYNRCMRYLHQKEIQSGITRDATFQAHQFINEEQELLRTEVLRQLELALLRLPALEQKIIKLAYVDKMRTRDIALALQMSESSIKKHKAHGLVLLRAIFGKSMNILLALL